jgi:hypothetical protein
MSWALHECRHAMQLPGLSQLFVETRRPVYVHLHIGCEYLHFRQTYSPLEGWLYEMKMTTYIQSVKFTLYDVPSFHRVSPPAKEKIPRHRGREDTTTGDPKPRCAILIRTFIGRPPPPFQRELAARSSRSGLTSVGKLYFSSAGSLSPDSAASAAAFFLAISAR